MLITVFTPTYNRAHLLKRVYKSLLQQHMHDFEWLLIDDGSTDATENVVRSFIAEGKILIKYFKQPNLGKHVAINKGVLNAQGTYFLMLDSDDYLPVNALLILKEKIVYAKQFKNIGGVVGRKTFVNKQLILTKFKENTISNSLDIRFKYNVQGDLAEVFKTAVLKDFPFPEIENEKFCPEALVWNRIAQKYDLLFFNEAIYVAEYLPDGLTHKIVKIRMQAPFASMLHYAELTNYKVPLLIKLKSAINFWRFSYNSSLSLLQKMKYIKHYFYVTMLPLGFLMYLNDKRK